MLIPSLSANHKAYVSHVKDLVHTVCMSKSLSEHKMAQNEVVFRKANQRVQEGFDELKSISEEDGAAPIEADPDMLFRFVCECSDENCTKRINLTLEEYNTIHHSSRYFVLCHGHEVPEIEDIVQTERDYIVVRKHKEPPQDAEELVEADVDNSDK